MNLQYVRPYALRLSLQNLRRSIPLPSLSTASAASFRKNFLVLSKQCANELGDSLKGNHRGWFTEARSSSREVGIRAPFFLLSILVGEPSHKKETVKGHLAGKPRRSIHFSLPAYCTSIRNAPGDSLKPETIGNGS